ncbi:hypothetical protein VKT23_013823 [Stygiomarasmius scandens]|uniref:3'-5' exonuclease domain-containing protein n=1 Tax=Marasmiellus scandens TaxID=2682957 RepID=A0ABR1J5A1_9AGAR
MSSAVSDQGYSRQANGQNTPTSADYDVGELNEQLEETRISSQSPSKNDGLDMEPVDLGDEVVDTKAALQAAVRDLAASEMLIVDCEGLNLGVRAGALSLLCIRSVSDTPRSYLFDVVLLERAKVSLQPVFELLSSQKIRKVFYDGRMDFCALYFGYRVTINNVIDLQIADVDSRALRGQGHEEQMQRLLRCLPYRQVHNPGNAGKYADVHLLQGLGACLVEHKVSGPGKDKVDHDTWMQRPLTDQQRVYAAKDLYLIFILLEYFQEAQYLSEDLPMWSQRYISIWSDAQPDDENVYRSHPLLPLEILRFDPTKVNVSSNRFCDGCQRSLSVRSFPLNHAHGTRSSGGRFCFVCMAVPLWIKKQEFIEEMKRKRREEKEKSEARKKGEAMEAMFGPVPPVTADGEEGPSSIAAGSPNVRLPKVWSSAGETPAQTTRPGEADSQGTSRGGRGRGRGRGGSRGFFVRGRGRGDSHGETAAEAAHPNEANSEGTSRGGRGRGRSRGFFVRGRGRGDSRGETAAQIAPSNETNTEDTSRGGRGRGSSRGFFARGRGRDRDRGDSREETAAQIAPSNEANTESTGGGGRGRDGSRGFFVRGRGRGRDDDRGHRGRGRGNRGAGGRGRGRGSDIMSNPE